MLTSLKKARAEADHKKPGVNYSLGESFNLRLLIHYVGDLHQPLHATTRYSENHQDGDEGGNFFLIQEIDKIKELHALWDSVVTEFSDDMDLVIFNTQSHL